MAATNNPGYSTLEYVPPTEFYNKKENALPVYDGLQVVPESGKESLVSSDDGLEVAPKYDGPGYIDADNVPPPVQPAKSRRKWLIIGGVVLLLVIIGAVLGGVLASKGKSANSSTADASSATSSTGSSAGTSASATGSSPSTAKPTSMITIQPRRNIAAVSWNSTSAANQTRLYFQNNVGEIVEAAVAGSKTKSAVLQADSKTGIALVTDGKLGSPLAAAVSRPVEKDFTISVFYLDANNLIHDIIYEKRTGSWGPGAIATKGYIAAPNSSLSAMYNQCRTCANTTILAFQDANNFIQIANRTITGWELTRVDINQLENTGLALQPYYIAGEEDQINLYYQRKDLKIATASWKSFGRTGKASAWAADQLYAEALPNVPIAAASSYHTVSTGSESWIQVISTAKTGITVSTWTGTNKDWLLLANQQSVFSNSSSPKSYDSLSVTATGLAFASVNSNGTSYIESWQLSDDWVSWKSAGSVPVKEAWN